MFTDNRQIITHANAAETAQTPAPSTATGSRYWKNLEFHFPRGEYHSSHRISEALESAQRPGLLESSIRLLKMTWKSDARLMNMRVASIMAITASSYGFTWSLGKLVDAINKASDTHLTADINQTIFWGAALAIASVGKSVFNFLSDYLKSKFEAYSTRRIEDLINTASINYPIENLESDQLKSMMAKINSNQHFTSDFMEGSFALIKSGIGVGAAAAALSQGHWLISAVVIAASLPGILVEKKYGEEKFKIENRLVNTRRKYAWHNWFLNTSSFLKELILFGQGNNIKNRNLGFLDRINSTQLELEKKQTFKRLAAHSVMEMAVLGSTAYLIHNALFSSESSVGQGVFLISCLLYFKNEIMELSDTLGRQFKNIEFVQETLKFGDVSAMSAERNNQFGNKETDLSAGAPKIELKNVSFGYPGKPLLFENLNLTIAPGTFLGIVGSNGSGKTTLMNLLAGIYRPITGQILVNDIDLLEINKNQWCAALSLMAQGAYPYESFSIRQIIELGVSEQREALDMEQVLEMSGLKEIIDRLPYGIETIVGTGFENSTAFSSGELQKIAFARMLIRNPLLMFLDEPGSNLDIHAQQQQAETIRIFSEGIKTRIMISHNYSALAKAGRIIVVAQGNIIEDGTHQELIEAGGVYAQNYRAEMDKYSI